MKRLPRACYFDLDGTLVGRSGEVHPRDLAVIRELASRGVAIGIATGRPWFAARRIAEQLSVTAPCMSFSGALITEAPDFEAQRIVPLQPSERHAVLELCELEHWYLEAYTADHYFVSRRTPLSEIHAHYLGELPQEGDLRELITNEQILKYVLVFSGAPPEQLPKQLQARAPSASIAIGYGAAHPDLSFVNITDRAASREAALQFICENLKCSPTALAAFGDGEADIPFLSEAGWGVAMENASESVRHSARFTTRSVEAQGVADFIEREFFN